MALDFNKFDEIYKDLKAHNYKNEYQKLLVDKFVKDYAKQKGISEADLYELNTAIETISFDVEKGLENKSTSKESLYNQLCSKCNDKIKKLKLKDDLKKQGYQKEFFDSSIAELSDADSKVLLDKFKLKGLKFDFKRLQAKVIINDKEQLRKELLTQATEQGYSFKELKAPAKLLIPKAPEKISFFDYSVQSIYDLVKRINKNTTNKNKPENDISEQENNLQPLNRKVNGINTSENSILSEGGQEYVNEMSPVTDIKRKGVMNAQVDAKNGIKEESPIVAMIDSLAPNDSKSDREKELEAMLGVKHGEMTLEEMEQLYAQMMMNGMIGPTKTNN